ncbi:hypothetical protein D3C78_880360 [compost metagenome]
MRHPYAFNTAAEAFHQQDFVGRRLRPGLLFILAHFDTAFMAVEGNMVALDRHIGVERIGDLHAAGIADRGAHGVGNVDFLAEDAGIAHIAVHRRRVLIESIEERIGAQIHGIIALAFVRTGATACSPERAVLAIVQQLSEALHFHGIGIEIPVQKIEMVGGLVHEQAAGMFGKGVPAAEIIRAVLVIEIPVKIDRGDGADCTLVDKLLDACGGGRETIVEGDVHTAAAFRLRGANTVNLFRGGGHGLFADDIGPAFQRADDDVVVSIVRRADDDEFRALLFHHPVEIVVKRRA